MRSPASWTFVPVYAAFRHLAGAVHGVQHSDVTDTTKPFERRCRLCAAVVPPGVAFCSRCGGAVEQTGREDPLLERVRALVGTELAIGREVGRGAMAVVYLGYDPVLQRRVAVKAIKLELVDDRELAERFQREARTVAALQHPNIVSVYGIRTDGQVSAILMQFVEGSSLDAAISDRPISLPAAGLVLAQVAAALQHAHERGVIHRDVKPANVLLDPEGRAVVSDFGIARREGSHLTGTGVIMGTVAYMSPEQCTGASVTSATDQYAFGVMAFELLAGRLPFNGSVSDVLSAQVHEPPPSLAELRPELPPAVTDYIMRALEKAPEARHADLRAADRVFRLLVQNAKDASTIVAAMAKGSTRKVGGSTVQQAITVPRRAPDGEAPTEFAFAPTPPATPAMVAATPTQPIPAPGTSRRGLIATAAAVVILGGAALAWRAIGHSSATTQNSPNARQAGDTSAAALRAAPSPGPTRAAAGEQRAQTNTPRSGAAASPSGGGASSNTPAEIPVTRTPPVEPPPVRDSVVPSATPATAAAPAVSATLADARAVAKEFATWCNQRRWRDLEQLDAFEGDPSLRAELIRLVRAAPDFAAGFDRLASTPEMTGERFRTELVLDLQWRGGQRLMLVRLQALRQNGTWHLAAFGTAPAE
jgi:serine/threonine-protein kinase